MILEKLTELLQEYDNKVQSLPFVVGSKMVKELDLTNLKAPIGYYDGKAIKTTEDLEKILKEKK